MVKRAQESQGNQETDTWQVKILDKVMPALIGAMAGLLSFLFVGYTEGARQFQVKRAEAYATFIRDSWGRDQASGEDQAPEEDEGLVLVRAVSGLTVYATEDVIETYAIYIKDCGLGVDSSACRGLWADVVNRMRTSLGEDAVDRQVIIQALYGE